MPDKVIKYAVLHRHFGAFPHGHVFTQHDYAKLYPAPKDVPDVSEWYDDMIARAVSLGAVVEVDVKGPTELPPAGPEFKQAKLPEPQHPAEKPSEPAAVVAVPKPQVPPKL